MKRNHQALFLCFAVVLLSCSKQEQQATDLVTFPLRGEVVSVDTAKLRVTIAHEEIPDYMLAMTMSFKVKDRGLLAGLEPGDSVQGTLAVSRSESWLAALSSTGEGSPPATISAGDVQMQRLFRPGDRLPEINLVNQNAQTIRFRNFRGKVLALTFVYTRCPLPDFCIRMSDHFSKIQRLLNQDAAVSDKWHLLTISFDPKFDSPKVLRDYARSYTSDTSTWDFATDTDSHGRNVLQLANGLDLTYEDDEGGLIAHNLRTVLLDQEGKLVEVIKDNEWKPEEVVEKIKTIVK